MPSAGPERRFLDVLDDAEQLGPVELSTPKGPVTVEYLEGGEGCWIYMIRRGSQLLSATCHDDHAIAMLKAEGVSFARAVS